MGSRNEPDRDPHHEDFTEILHLTMPAAPGAVVLARRQLTRFLQRLALPERIIGDLAVAVGEALTNSVEHGTRTGTKIDLQARLLPAGVEVRVTDDGPGFRPQPRPLEPPENTAPRGFGIYLMYSLMDEVEYNESGTSVRLFKNVPPGQAFGRSD